ncbi:MAG: 1,4-alpha-glucan branching protein GlgB [Nevskiaceae bacterium]|jgi:1,4-alpha-glucan branching enzyme|nr:1,4-alpha-glucan branching protein GlgB [Nevskiaceae bacterium]
MIRIAEGRSHDPHGVLGPHHDGAITLLRVYLPSTRSARLVGGAALERAGQSDFFIGQWPRSQLPAHPIIEWVDDHGIPHTRADPYSFAPTLSADDLALFASGGYAESWRMLGAHPATFDDVPGIRFAVWAPNAERVSVVGPFCDWDGRRLPMRVLGRSGVWELFVPGLPVGQLYKYEIRNRSSGNVETKTDPYARAMELRPATASIIQSDDAHAWKDDDWMQARAQRDWLHAPLSIYEVHTGSWQRHTDGSFLDWNELADQLIPHVQSLGYTHIELLPITEHPLDDSWGYQTTGYFAPTRRHGTPDDLKRFIERCHRAGIGVLLDWVPAHFPRDAHGLARFDGSALYEYEDPRKGEHADWGTYIFNYERNEVRSFLLSSACYWLEQFHFDGLRVDAVASMLYLDFGRQGIFAPNRYGGRENLEAIDFLRQLNTLTHSRSPGTLMMAEESTDWPLVSRPVDVGGLGFSMKWNMGWMHDTLDYFQVDPIFRSHHHERLTFGQMYAYSENFILPLSHDEVVHLKRSLLGRMPGDRWQQLANLRALYFMMWMTPGKKLLFMGGEFAHPWEWDFHVALPWFLLEHNEHRGMMLLLSDLNRLYVNEPALHRHEFEPQGFAWIDCNDREQSTLSWLRSGGDEDGDGNGGSGPTLVVALNLTPQPRMGYEIGVPEPGEYRVLLNSDSVHYGGSNLGGVAAPARLEPRHGQPYSLRLDLPPLGGLLLVKAS